ncbi:MAG: BatD family protein [Deltaproteobacteria bacterium]|nr:BatD family protein [Deltaproteobacteria bacterium]
MRNKLFLFFIFFFWTLSAQAQGVVVEASVDKPIVSLDDQVVLTIKIKGGNVFSEPKMPSRGNFEVLSRGSSSNVVMMNGQIQATKEYHYILAPLKAGEFEIGPITVEVEGVEYKASPISVTVKDSGGARGPPSQNPSSQAPWTPGFPMPQAPQASPVNPNGATKDVFVTAEVSNKTPYVGQQIVYTFKVFTIRNVTNTQLTLPDFHDFWSEDLIKDFKSYQQIGNDRYVVVEFRVALIPSKAGTLNIAEAVLKADVEQSTQADSFFNDPFFRSPSVFRPRVMKAPAISVEVQELPAGAPAEFKGLVGQFDLKNSISKKDLSVGETATLNYQIEGFGNIKDAVIEFNPLIPNLKIYPDKPTQKLKKDALGISGSKNFSFALVPEAPGKIQIPDLKLSYFDLKKQSYETLTAPGFELSVVPGQNENMAKVGGASSSAAPVNELGEDIASIHRQVKISHQEPSYEFFYLIALLFAAPPFILGVAYWIYKRQQWKEENSDLLKKRRAYSRAVSAIKEIDLKSETEIPQQLTRLLKDYLGDKLQRLGTALTPSEVELLFSKNAKKTQTGLAWSQFLQQLEGWQYAGLPQEAGWQQQAKKMALDLLKKAEKELS